MIDAMLSLKARGHEGPVMALSRRGLRQDRERRCRREEGASPRQLCAADPDPDVRKTVRWALTQLTALTARTLHVRGHDALTQGLFQIGLEVAYIFDADRETDQPVHDADPGANIGGNGGMRHHGGIFDQALDASQAFRERE